MPGCFQCGFELTENQMDFCLWNARIKAPVPPTAPPSPGYYHVLYKEHAQAQMAWHGETYCLIGGYRVYGDAPLATPAKAEEEKPAPRRALKRQRVQEESDQDLGCPSAKIPRLKMNHGGKGVSP